ncbi:alpha/beta hydrolase [Peptostreptococcaceae bacterium oral taxon 081]|nr:alpha/beta hydrolase [Peptostreptococcaceae bacterium oral taxon 081]
MKKFKIIIAVILASILFLLVFIGDYFYTVAIDSSTDKSSISNQEQKEEEYYIEEENWFLNNKKEVKMTSVTGFNLVGYKFLNDKSDKWVIVTHGYGSNAYNMAYYIKKFYDLGYNVFAPDLIGLGKSEGKFISMGGYDSKDMKKWIDVLNDTHDKPDIALFGISMGATTVMNVLDEELTKNVKVFIEDSGYIDAEEELRYQLKKLYNLPSFPFISLASIITKIKAGYYIEEVNATDSLIANKLPALILHGDKDGFVPLDNAHKTYELLQSDNPKYIYISKGCKHVEGAKKDAQNYWATVNEFLIKHF